MENDYNGMKINTFINIAIDHVKKLKQKSLVDFVDDPSIMKSFL